VIQLAAMVDRGLAKVIAIPNKSGAEPRIIKHLATHPKKELSKYCLS
jgi:hypothetical protein